jgi:hypothetical protein
MFLPRITLGSEDPKLPFKFTRLQYPVRPCFAMTINKAQGQSLERVGVYLPDPVFAHGQLYVADSRVDKPDDLRMLITHQEPRGTPPGATPGEHTLNVVDVAVLQCIEASLSSQHTSQQKTGV